METDTKATDQQSKARKPRTSGWYLMPPFMGPRALSCCTLNPTYETRLPSSLGIVHSTWSLTKQHTNMNHDHNHKKDQNKNWPISWKRTGTHFDLSKRDQKTPLKLRVKPKNACSVAKVTARCCKSVHDDDSETFETS